MLRTLSTLVVLLLASLAADAASLVYGVDGIKFAWASDDKVAFMTATGQQIRFSITDIAADGHCASTTGNGWALKQNTAYYAYAPYNVSYSINENTAQQLPVSYADQQQMGNDNTSHLFASAFFCGSVNITPETPAANVALKPMTAVVRIMGTFPKPVVVTKVSLTAAAAQIPLSGYMNIVEQKFVPADVTSTISIQTDNISVANGEAAIAYITLPPCSLSGDDITATFHTVDGDAYETVVRGFDIESGLTYCIGGNASPTTPTDYVPEVNGTASSPVVIASDLPIQGSYVPTPPTPPAPPTAINSTSVSTSSAGYDILGRRSAGGRASIVINNGKKKINHRYENK